MVDTGKIETMKLEKYIQGVVAAEMDPSWPLEALKAQAIVSRTFTIEALERSGGVASKHAGADVSTDPGEFQAYNASRVNDNVRRAVNETRGQIITYAGRPVRAWFHADSGGMTATPAEGLGAGALTPPATSASLPYLNPVKVPWTEPNAEWTATFTAEEVKAAAAKTGAAPEDVSSVAVGRKGPSGRAIDLVVGTSRVPAPEFRLAIGRTRMKSTLLTSVSMSGDSVVFKGRGNGHGVGMSQWAARVMASQGKRASDIISYFYRDTAILPIWQ